MNMKSPVNNFLFFYKSLLTRIDSPFYAHYLLPLILSFVSPFFGCSEMILCVSQDKREWGVAEERGNGLSTSGTLDDVPGVERHEIKMKSNLWLMLRSYGQDLSAQEGSIQYTQVISL